MRTIIISFIVICIGLPQLKAAAQNPHISSHRLFRDSAFAGVWDSYDTTQVAYNALQPNGYYGVYFGHVSPSGHLINETCFTCGNAALPGKNMGCPAFHPAGKYVALIAEKAVHPGSSANSVPGVGTFSDIWVVTRDGQHSYQLTHTAATGDSSGVLFVFFSPDGRKLSWTEMTAPVNVFNGKQAAGYWVIKIADFKDDSILGPGLSNVRTLQPGGVPAFNEAYGWSPDGSKIIFASDYDQFWFLDDQIYDMDTNGNNIHQLTKCCDYNEHAFYTPDGGSIVWMTNTGTNMGTTKGGDDWWVMHSDSTHKERLTFFNDTVSPYWTGNTHILGHGCFSPDGKHIIGDVGGSQPIQVNPGDMGGVYMYDIGGSAGIQDEASLTMRYRLYPNPANGLLNIDLDRSGDISYKVYNISGAITGEGHNYGSSFAIDISSFAGGLYLIRLQCGNSFLNTKFIISQE